jgi:hypothetical protein
MGIPTSRNLDTPEGPKSWLSVGIHRIPVELPHSTELDLGNLRRIPAKLPRSTYSKDSRQAKSSDPHNLASLSTLQE